ncbi:DNA (cytosine-5-)-methyltransferase [Persicimonas caeni]|uniref:Cytosine-specific methyltransferase n=1 Tax=Persicimonas caeni TaxID=2292766 RepID=A0A4Y6PUT4_PERCE|nr:DNA (cytosine-5-)-methyltransferase [Persicimonas caeni]QDG52096.1 DNA (cytosine-5-)-methyltransferase [Persicimonas caeni]QED33317.1 DNA (cytosine-5-)-methyltransferase [Persicimonas caeni]
MGNNESHSFDFIDLFAGIGGIRIALEKAGGHCVMTSEIDKWARKTYQAYFNDGDDHLFNEDITAIEPAEVPDHDVLAGGFPCQPFSLAGVSKKNALGRSHGFDDPTKGTLFFNIKKILMEKTPSAFLLENVKNLRSHDGGDTWKVIAYSLHQAGYAFTDKIIDAADVLPQHRERVFIVGFHRETFGLGERRLDWSSFWQTVEEGIERRAESYRQEYEVSADQDWPLVKHVLEDHADVPDKYTLTPGLWEYLQEYRRKHRAKGNGFGYGMVKGDEAYTRTISARYYKDGSEALVYQGEEVRPRRLTPLECSRLQGFPKEFQKLYERTEEVEQPVSDTQAYKQFGNSVCVPVVEAIADPMSSFLADPEQLHALPDTDEPFQAALFNAKSMKQVLERVGQ